VRSADPRIRVFDVAEVEALLDRPEFSPVVTADAARRRDLYRTQERRAYAEERFNGDHLEFLRQCEIRVRVTTHVDRYADRLHELVQRTNQLNFSGNRHTRSDLDRLLADPRYEAFAIDCEDRFGEYGLIGFALVDRAIPRLVDFALSCRVQAKRVEHAFLGFLLARERQRGTSAFEAIYRPTERNRAAGAVFADLGFEEVSRDETGTVLRFDLGRAIPDDRIATILEGA
jgi:FkbH-like protein